MLISDDSNLHAFVVAVVVVVVVVFNISGMLAWI